MEPAEFGYWARQWGRSLRSVREYRHTAKMCTPAVCKMLAGSRVLVSYTVLREGARKGPSGVPHDEEFEHGPGYSLDPPREESPKFWR